MRFQDCWGMWRHGTDRACALGGAAVRERARGGQQAVASDWALDWDNEMREAPPAQQPQPGVPAPAAPEQAGAGGGRPAVRVLDALSEEAISNTADMQLVFLGTSGRLPTQARCAAPPIKSASGS